MLSFVLVFITFLHAYPVSYIEKCHERFIDPSSKIVFSSESKMYLTGSTNLSTFKCDCASIQNNIPLYFEYVGNKAIFQNIGLEISSRNMDCHQELYNSNIKKALQADKYPFVTVNLMEAWKSDYSLFMNETDWFDIVAKTNLNIKETTKIEEVNAKAIRLSDNKYRIKGSQALSMKDYNVTVPQILFGLIQVEDKIVFNFDLVFEIL